MIYDPEVQTLADLPRVQARLHPARPALTCEDRSVTYGELGARCEALAGVLAERGLRKGDRVGLVSKESVDAVTLLFAAARCGAVVVPINWRLSPAEVAFIAADAQCRFVFASAEAVPLTAQIREPGVAIPLEDEVRRAGAEGGAPAPELAVDPGDVAAQLYTSGTTGQPKGVELPHDTFFAIAREFHARELRWMGWSPDDVALCVLPLFHVGGLWWLIRGLASGAHNVVLPQFVGWRAIEAIARHRVTKAGMVPAMIQVMLAEPDAEPARLASLRVLAYGGSPISPALQERAMAMMGCDFYQVYGLTETGNMAVCLWPDDHRTPARLASAGRALPGVSVKIVDEVGRELPAGQVGEVWIRSPAAMRGYWRNPEATAHALRDGWVHTGDAGHCDADGYLYISDRIKDMICTAGEKVWPAEVEAVLARHPAVREIAIIGVPHAAWGEAIKAVVVPRSLSPAVTLGDLRTFGRQHLADFKLPSSLDLAEALPRTPVGKVQKRVLRETYWRSEPRRVG
jgi:acyl-CoA synthetase (AMP-forming)/AMP-acid ligase II